MEGNEKEGYGEEDSGPSKKGKSFRTELRGKNI